MVQRLAGIGDEVSQSLGAIVDAVGQLLKPNAKFEQAMKGMFLEKPELMQKFVDVEKANPGTLAAMGFGKGATDLLSGMQESIPGLQARLLAPKIAAEMQRPGSSAVAERVTSTVSGGKSASQLADEELALFMNKTIRPLLGDGHSDIAIEMMNKRFGLMSPGQKAQDIAAVPTAQVHAAVAGQTLESIEAAKPIRELPPMDQVMALVKGKLTGDQVAGVLVGPQKMGFEAAMELYKQERSLTVQQLSARYLGSQSDPLARARQTAAFDAWKAHQGQGTVQGWYNQLWPQNNNEIGTSAPGDAAVIANALKDEQFAKRTDQIRKVMTAIEPDIKSITEAKTALTATSVNTRIANINSVLRANDSEWEAIAEPPGGFLARIFTSATGRWNVMYKNKAGDITDDPGALISNVPPVTIKAQEAAAADLTGPQKVIVQQLMGMTGDVRKAAIAQLRARSPRLAEQIITAAGGEIP